MKKIFTLIIGALLCCVSVCAADMASFVIDGIGYSIIDGTSNVLVGQLRNGTYTGNVVVPDVITYNDKSYTVTEIGIDAFRKSTVKIVVLPNTITEIRGGAFNECSELIQVKIPSSVTTLGDCVFKKCSKLTTMTIPASVTSCSFRQMFAECTSLLSVYINCDPNITKGKTSGEWSIGTLTFMGCSNLADVYMSSAVPPALKGDDGIAPYIATNTTVDNIFSNMSSVNINIPSGSMSAYTSKWGTGDDVIVTYKENQVVANVASVTVNGTTTKHTDIYAAMAKAQVASTAIVTLLSDVTLGTNETMALTQGNITLDLNGYTLKGNCKTTEGNAGAITVLGANLTICDESNAKTGKIVHTASSSTCGVVVQKGSLTVNSGYIEGKTSAVMSKDHAVLTINGGRFMSDYATIFVTTKAAINGGEINANDRRNGLWILTGGDVTLAGGSFSAGANGYAISIYEGKCTFKSGYAYKYTNASGIVEYGTTTEEMKKAGEVVLMPIEFVVDGIRYKVIDGTNNVYVMKPESGVYSGDVVIPSEVTYAGKTYTVTELGLEAFRNATITSISLPNTLTTIGGSAFNGCRDLKELDIPSSVTTINDCAFKDCKALTSMVIPSTVTDCTFRQLFSGCSNLEEVYINCTSDNTSSPSTGEWTMGDLTFDGCSKLTSIYMQSEVAPQLKGAISSSYTSGGYSVGTFDYSAVFPANATVYMPNGSKDNYVSTWGCEEEKVVELKNVPTPVDAIEADAEVVYYDLSGRRVDANAKGVVIKKQGNKTTKYINR